jgi:hypothetical protein
MSPQEGQASAMCSYVLLQLRAVVVESPTHGRPVCRKHVNDRCNGYCRAAKILDGPGHGVTPGQIISAALIRVTMAKRS